MLLTVDQAEVFRRQLEREISAEDKQHWIEKYVRIEDRDAPMLAVPFLLWPGQIRTLKEYDTFRLNMVLKARQLGLSWLTLAYAAHGLIFRPGYSVVALSRGENEAKELARRIEFILRYLPEWMAQEGRGPGADLSLPRWTATTSVIECTHPQGEPSTFQSLPAAANSGRSFTANLVILDEWAFQQWARQIWTAAYPTINRPTGGQLIGLSTIERGTLFEDLWMASKDGKNRINRVFLPWNTDPRRTPEWYEETRQALGDAVLAEYPATEEEAFTTPGGAFFPELRAHIHLVPVREIPAWHQRMIVFDYGMDMLACYWVSIDGQGRATVYRELYESGLAIPEATRAILEVNKGEPYCGVYAPPDMWNVRNDTGKEGAQVFRENGLVLRKASNARENGWNLLHAWLTPYKGRHEQTGQEIEQVDLQIVEGACPNLWRTLLAIQKSKTNPNDAARTPHELTHAPDAIRYFAATWTRPSREPAQANEDAPMTGYNATRKAITGGAKRRAPTWR